MPRIADRPDVLTFGAWICVGHEVSPGNEDSSRVERGKPLLEALNGPQVTFPGLEQLGGREALVPASRATSMSASLRSSPAAHQAYALLRKVVQCRGLQFVAATPRPR